MASLEETLAAVLKAEVDKRVAAVQAAADAAVAAFAKLAESIARGDTKPGPTPEDVQPEVARVVERIDTNILSQLPPEIAERARREEAQAQGTTVTYHVNDESAALSNMAPLHVQRAA
jgi:hypothetical protein